MVASQEEKLSNLAQSEHQLAKQLADISVQVRLGKPMPILCSEMKYSWKQENALGGKLIFEQLFRDSHLDFRLFKHLIQAGDRRKEAEDRMQLLESKVALLNLSSGPSNEDHVGKDQGHRISTRMDVSSLYTCAPVSLYTPVSASAPVSVSLSATVCVSPFLYGLSFLHVLKDVRCGWGDVRYWRDALKDALRLLKAGSTGALLPSKVG